MKQSLKLNGSFSNPSRNRLYTMPPKAGMNMKNININIQNPYKVVQIKYSSNDSKDSIILTNK